MPEFNMSCLEDEEGLRFLDLHERYVAGRGSLKDANDHAEFAYLLAKGRAELRLHEGSWRVRCALEGLHDECPSWVAATDATIDHILMRDHGGTHEADNLQTACYHCNSSKNGS